MRKKKNEYIAVGGQALMEGIMMKGPKGTAMSLRLPDGSIETQMKDFVSVRKKFKPFNLPIIRGVVSFVESMIFGYKLIMESAEKTSMDLEEEAESKLDKWISDHFGPKMMAVVTGISMVLGCGLAFVLFFYLPTFLVDTVDKHLFKDALANLHPLFEGIMRMFIFVAYIWLVSKVPDIKKVFMYHGAEHKTIHAFEAGGMVTVATARKGSRLHPRCGTTFLLFVLSLAIILHTVLVPLFLMAWHPESAPLRHAGIVLFKILLIVPVSSMAYELIRWSAALEGGFCVRVLRAPGLFLQYLTTREPDDAQLEVAVAALREALGPDSPYADRFETAENTVTE